MTTSSFLVALDEGPEADRVLDCATALAAPAQAHLILFHVRDEAALNPWAFTAGATRHARQALEQLLDPVRSMGLTGEVVLAHGKPWREICEAAKKRRVALVVLGCGRQRAAAKLLGSVTSKVVRLAPCPVWVTSGQPNRLTA